MNDAAPHTQQNAAPLDHAAIHAIMMGIKGANIEPQ